MARVFHTGPHKMGYRGTRESKSSGCRNIINDGTYYSFPQDLFMEQGDDMVIGRKERRG